MSISMGLGGLFGKVAAFASGSPRVNWERGDIMNLLQLSLAWGMNSRPPDRPDDMKGPVRAAP
jgi:hypothetical protein